jgi:RNA recognition motif-containing protein
VWSDQALPKTAPSKQNFVKAPPGTWSAKPVKAATEPRLKTTIMLRNLPNDYTRDMFLQILDDAGFKLKYDFVYMPMDFKKSCGLGYAFVNLRTYEDAVKMWNDLNGFNNWVLPSQKVMAASWGKPTQGFDALVERFRNSSVFMQPDEYHPVLFDENGVRRPFPEKK